MRDKVGRSDGRTGLRGLTLLFLASVFFAHAEAQSAPPDLTGLWQAWLGFGPDVRGPLIVYQTRDGWRADIAGFSVPVTVEGTRLAFELPDAKGKFRGARDGGDLAGHWIQPRTQFSGLSYATPVRLQSDGPNRWRGNVAPFDDRFTFYLPVSRLPDGSLRTYLRNPERNQGRFIPVSRIALDGGDVVLSGRDSTQTRGRYEDGVISVVLRGGTYDFTRATDSASNPFYPRSKPAPRYRYAPPLALDDGWPVGSVEDVGISRQAIEQFVQLLLDEPMDSINSQQIHSLLIARRGRLVVEEYFHGYHRDQPHDLRSASKSWVATVIGAAMQAGVPIRMDTPVYATLLGTLPADLDAGKRAMTLGHLMAMTAGYRCGPDDPVPTADEDVIQQQGATDWYAYTLAVPLISAPGEKVFYCSAEPNLAGAVLAKVAAEPTAELFERLVARPMQMRGYHLMLQPTGEAYGGGGHQFTPREFLKLPQLLVGGGRWNGRQILPADWLRQITAALRDLSPIQQYAYLWNSVEYPYGDRKVRAFFAGGNGGQVFMAIPDLDLVIGFTGGNYGQAATFTAQRTYVPRYVLPAVR